MLKEYIQAVKKKDWICKSKSLAISNIFIVYKLDNPKKYLIIDYWKLNNIIIKNKYLLSNLKSLQNILTNTVIFIKLNQKTSFTLIYIKERYE